VTFEPLSHKHLDSLLRFERENRAWFETLISARDPRFYTREGVKRHIDSALTNLELKNGYSAVLMDANQVCARGNLKNINAKNKVCFVGYRVAQYHTGKGHASYCLAKLINVAKETFKMDELRAKVLSNNPASASVLNKNGFIELSNEKDIIRLNGELLSCVTFSLKIQ